MKYVSSINITEEFPFNIGRHSLEAGVPKEIPDNVANVWIYRGYPVKPHTEAAPVKTVEAPAKPSNRKR